uniref:HTH_Tnp_Tc3_1 domain-containing protein n=1 Tax=Mesocestoides corti TaxID=53468 RepID=A0A5K3FXZ6_MESCO
MCQVASSRGSDKTVKRHMHIKPTISRALRQLADEGHMGMRLLRKLDENSRGARKQPRVVLEVLKIDSSSHSTRQVKCLNEIAPRINDLRIEKRESNRRHWLGVQFPSAIAEIRKASAASTASDGIHYLLRAPKPNNLVEIVDRPLNRFW